MTAADMLKKAGYPDTESGRKAFYKKYPTEKSFLKKFAPGGVTTENPPSAGYTSPYSAVDPRKYYDTSFDVDMDHVNKVYRGNTAKYISDRLNDQATLAKNPYAQQVGMQEANKNLIGYTDAFKEMRATPLQGYDNVYQRGNMFYAAEPSKYDPKRTSVRTILDPRIKQQPATPAVQPQPQPAVKPQPTREQEGWTEVNPQRYTQLQDKLSANSDYELMTDPNAYGPSMTNKQYVRMKKREKGGEQELAFPQAPNSNQFYNIGVLPSSSRAYYAHGGSHMPYVHYQTAGEVSPEAIQAMMENQGGNIPLATRQPGSYPIDQLPRFEEGGMDPKSMAEQLLTIRSQYENMNKRQLKKEMEDLQQSMSNSYQENDPSVAMRLSVITELLGEDAPMMQTGGIAFPQQPTSEEYFSAFPFNNEYRKGGAPCYKCGGMYDTGGNTPFNYGYFPMEMAGGGYVGLDTTDNSDYLTYAAGGESPQGLTMDDYMNAQNNVFKNFLANTSQAYNAGQVMQQGEMGQLPENRYGNYNAMMPSSNLNYNPYSNTEGFSDVNMNAYQSMQAERQNADKLSSNFNKGTFKKFMGNMYGNMARKQMAKQNQQGSNPGMQSFQPQQSQTDALKKSVAFDPNMTMQSALANKKADDEVQFRRGGYYNLPMHETPPGNTTGATNTSIAVEGPNAGLSPEMMTWIKEAMKNKSSQQPGLTIADLDKWYEQKNKQPQAEDYQNRTGSFYNPWTGTYESVGGMYYPGSDVRYKASGPGWKIKGRGAFPGGIPMQGNQMLDGYYGYPTGTMDPAALEQQKEYMKMLTDAGFKGKFTQLRSGKGLLGKLLGEKYALDWSYGNPAQQEQAPLLVDRNAIDQKQDKPGLLQRLKEKMQQHKKPADKSGQPSTSVPSPGMQQQINQGNQMPVRPSMQDFMQTQVTPFTTPYQEPGFVDMMNSQTLPGPRDQQAYGGNIYNYGGSQGDDIMWLSDDEIKQFEAGGGVLEYLDGGQTNQYY